MSADKYPGIFSRQMEAIVYLDHVISESCKKYRVSRTQRGEGEGRWAELSTSFPLGCVKQFQKNFTHSCRPLVVYY